MGLRKFLVPVFAALVALASAPSADAAFQVRINTSGGLFDTVVDEGGLDLAQLDTTLINANFEALNTDLADLGFKINALQVTSNAPSATLPAFLNLTFSVTRINALGDGFIQIIAQDDRYNVSQAGLANISSAGGPNFTNAVGSNAQVTNNYTNGSSTILASPVFFATDISQNFAFNAGPVSVGSVNGPFTLTTTFTANLLTVGATVGIDNSLVVASAIPEPASMAMLLIGGSVFSVRSLRRRKATV